METQRFDSARQLWHLLAPYKARVLGLSVLISASAALGTVSPQFVRVAFDVVIPRGEASLFLILAGAFAGFYVIRALMGYAGMYLSYAFTQSIISDIRMRAFGRMLRLPVVRFTEERSGSLVSRVVSDVNALEGMIQAGATRLMGQLFSILVVAAILVVMNPQLALVNLVVAPLLAGVTRHYQGPLREAARRIRSRVGEMTAVASEAITNIQVVKVFANEPWETDRFGDENNTYVQLNLDRRKEVGRMESLITLTAEYGIGAILLIGGWMTAEGSLKIGELTAFLMYQRMLQRPILSVTFFNNQLQSGMAALERVADLLDAQEETSGQQLTMPKGSVAFRNVTFTYPSADTPALRNLSLDIAHGQTAALVGPSGSGKSTMTRLLGRLFDVDEGRVEIGGTDVREYALDTLRRSIAVVPQDPTLFSGSVRDNIRYARPSADDEAVEKAARQAHAHEFIQNLPDAYDTEIGERGVKLSGGQKQRVAIARAILKNACILVLDEATASLDSESEAIIQEALDGLFDSTDDAGSKGVTSIIIAHRLSTIRKADRIFVLEDGGLVQSGTHEQLMSQGGLYQHLHDLQHRDEGVASDA